MRTRKLFDSSRDIGRVKPDKHLIIWVVAGTVGTALTTAAMVYINTLPLVFEVCGVAGIGVALLLLALSASLLRVLRTTLVNRSPIMALRWQGWLFVGWFWGHNALAIGTTVFVVGVLLDAFGTTMAVLLISSSLIAYAFYNLVGILPLVHPLRAGYLWRYPTLDRPYGATWWRHAAVTAHLPVRARTVLEQVAASEDWADYSVMEDQIICWRYRRPVRSPSLNLTPVQSLVRYGLDELAYRSRALFPGVIFVALLMALPYFLITTHYWRQLTHDIEQPPAGVAYLPETDHDPGGDSSPLIGDESTDTPDPPPEDISRSDSETAIETQDLTGEDGTPAADDSGNSEQPPAESAGTSGQNGGQSDPAPYSGHDEAGSSGESGSDAEPFGADGEQGQADDLEEAASDGDGANAPGAGKAVAASGTEGSQSQHGGAGSAGGSESSVGDGQMAGQTANAGSTGDSGQTSGEANSASDGNGEASGKSGATQPEQGVGGKSSAAGDEMSGQEADPSLGEAGPAEGQPRENGADGDPSNQGSAASNQSEGGAAENATGDLQAEGSAVNAGGAAPADSDGKSNDQRGTESGAPSSNSEPDAGSPDSLPESAGTATEGTDANAKPSAGSASRDAPGSDTQSASESATGDGTAGDSDGPQEGGEDSTGEPASDGGQTGSMGESQARGQANTPSNSAQPEMGNSGKSSGQSSPDGGQGQPPAQLAAASSQGAEVGEQSGASGAASEGQSPSESGQSAGSLEPVDGAPSHSQPDQEPSQNGGASDSAPSAGAGNGGSDTEDALSVPIGDKPAPPQADLDAKIQAPQPGQRVELPVPSMTVMQAGNGRTDDPGRAEKGEAPYCHDCVPDMVRRPVTNPDAPIQRTPNWILRFFLHTLE